MIGQAVIVGFALLVVAGVGAVSKFFLHDPCEGDGNFRDPVEFRYYDDGDEEESNE